MKNTTVFDAMGMVRESLITESLTLFELPATAVRPRRKERFYSFMSSNWAAAIICAFVGISVIAGIAWVGNNPPDMPPASSDTEQESAVDESEIFEKESDKQTDHEAVPLPTSGLVIQGDVLLYVTKYQGTATNVVIPESYDDRPVRGIAADAFKKSNIVSVTIPDTIHYIRESAFSQCQNLKTLHLPASVEEIDPTAFFGCTALESITVDEGNTYYRAEGNCLIEIATGRLIVGCKNSVIPDDGSVKIIGRRAFYECTGLATLHLPDSLSIIEEEAFYGAAGLTLVTGGEGLTEIMEKAFYLCGNLARFPFCEGLKIIGERAFSGCRALTHAILPEGMEKIRSQAFADCTSLTNVSIPVDGDMYGELFTGVPITSFTVPEGRTSIGEMFSNNRNIQRIYLPSTLESIVDRAFTSCYELHDIHYNGTKAQWLALVGDYQNWMGFVKEFTLHCTDGDFRYEYDGYQSVTEYPVS